MVYLIGNTAWGYCFTPMPFESENKARAYGREMKRDGYWFSYRIIKIFLCIQLSIDVMGE